MFNYRSWVSEFHDFFRILLSFLEDLKDWCDVISFNVHSISAFVTSSLETKESIVPLPFGLGQVRGGIHISNSTVFSLFVPTGLKKDFNAPHVFVQYFRRG